jgi:hypothetical protein
VNPSNLASPDKLHWRVAQGCNGGTCVQVALGGDSIFIGDSKNPDGDVLRYTRSEWATFIIKIKRGEFDRF